MSMININDLFSDQKQKEKQLHVEKNLLQKTIRFLKL